MKIIKVNLLFILIYVSTAYSFTFHGQLSSWLNFVDTGIENTKFGLRYIPEFYQNFLISETQNIDIELSANSYVSGLTGYIENVKNNSDIKPYRLSIRYSFPQFESRLGLQKINFGSAKYLRPLMWFDKLDPQDPLKLTDGVYALLTRYYFVNNTNIWLWFLNGNDKTKGWESVETAHNTIESGGRVQLPVPKGELGVSYHQRYVDKTDWQQKMFYSLTGNGLENRYGLDGSWDLGIGLWFETSLVDIVVGNDKRMISNQFCIGSDYTLKSGIIITIEHFIQSLGSKVEDITKRGELSIISLNYSLSIIDKLNFVEYYNWSMSELYTYFIWQRVYDNFMINLTLFSAKNNYTNSMNGNGLQIMVSYNH